MTIVTAMTPAPRRLPTGSAGTTTTGERHHSRMTVTSPPLLIDPLPLSLPLPFRLLPLMQRSPVRDR